MGLFLTIGYGAIDRIQPRFLILCLLKILYLDGELSQSKCHRPGLSILFNTWTKYLKGCQLIRFQLRQQHNEPVVQSDRASQTPVLASWIEQLSWWETVLST
jgi:hypothetical protein